MDVLILAAGFSTRLHPLTLTCAKPLLPVAGRPMVDYLVDKAQAVPDLGRILVVCNEKFHADFVAWGRRHPSVTIVSDGTRDDASRLGAIRDIEFAVRTQGVREDLLAVAGDNLFDASLAEFVRQARACAPRVAIGIVDLQDRALIRKRYGVVELDAAGRVTAFAEKPEDPATTLVSTGIYYFPASQLPVIGRHLEGGGKTDNIGDLIHALVQSPGIQGIRLPGRWFDIGDLASYELADRTFSEQRDK